MRPGAPLPRVLAITVDRYKTQFTARRGPLWDYFRDKIPAIYDDAGAHGARRRGLRTDGADSFLCTVVGLLSNCDLRRGFVGRPPAEAGGKWHRRSVRELFRLTFGEPVKGALGVRRLERWLRSLKVLGIVTTQQLRAKSARGYESVTAIRHVTDELFRLAGTLPQLMKERREAFQRAAAVRAGRCTKKVSDRSGAIPAEVPEGSGKLPGAPSSGEPRAGPPQAMRDLIARLKLAKPRS